MKTTFKNIHRLTASNILGKGVPQGTTLLKKDCLNDVVLESTGRKMQFALVERIRRVKWCLKNHVIVGPRAALS